MAHRPPATPDPRTGPGPAPDRAPDPTTGRGRRIALLVLLCLAQFMLIVDMTVVQVALPAVGADLDLDRTRLTWVVTAYALAFGGLMVLGGQLADTFGARRLLLIGTAVFTAASLVCGLAPTGEVLVLGRVLQGIGAALVSPAALATIATTFSGTERARALGVWAAIGGTGAAVGVLLGGVLTDGPGWEWIFYVNVPVGLLIVLALPVLLPSAPRPAGRRSVDVPGALLVTLATALLIYGLVGAGDAGWSAPAVLLPLAGAAAAYAGFLAVEARVSRPLVRPAVLAARPVLSGMFLMLVGTGLLLGLFFLTSLYLQHVLGVDALRTGLLFLPVAVAITAGARLAARLISRVGGRAVAAGGFALAAVGAGLLAQASPGDGVLTGVLPGFVVAAFGIGPLFVTATTTTLAHVPHGESGVASGVLNTFHELGGAVGVAVVSAVAAAGVAAGAVAPQAAADGFATAYLVCAVTAGAAVLVSAVLVPPGRPQGVVGHGHGH
jgi:EmrB/QacA subfamily drug resistance transporter